MNLLRGLTKAILILLAIGTVGTLMMGGFMPLFSMAFGIMFIYYLAVHFAAKRLNPTENKAITVCFYVLFFVPIGLLIVDGEGFINFLLSGIQLDMK